MRKFVAGFGLGMIVGIVSLIVALFVPRFIDISDIRVLKNPPGRRETPLAKTPEEMFEEALERSSRVKGLYMTADVANDAGIFGTRLRNNIIRLATSTEINGIVIDVKEVCGPDYNTERISGLIDALHREDIWVIARIVAFKDASHIDVNPEWYLSRKTPLALPDDCWHKRYLRAKDQTGAKPDSILWQDRRGGYWLDPTRDEVQQYLIDFSKRMIDLGFDELQYDYIRFPSDGDVENAIYPVWDGKTARYKVMGAFFNRLDSELKSYKPNIILSADLFGYVALNAGDIGIGQRLEDIGNAFDYVSFMVYPSHYYNGFVLPQDPVRNLPAINLSPDEVRRSSGVVVERTLLSASDFFKRMYASTSTLATSTEETITPSPRKKKALVRLRPWLEDFFHESDREAGRPYGVEKMRSQIDAAERVEKHGWILWNAGNIYTEGALMHE